MSEDDARTGASGAELDHEQRFTDEAYSRLDRMRAEYRDAQRRVHASHGVGNAQGWTEREAIASHYGSLATRLEQVEDRLVFGRLDADDGSTRYIGRTSLSRDDGSPLLIDWRAPAAMPFYRATPVDPQGVARRRHITTRRRRVVALEDELLDADSARSQGLELQGEGALMSALGQAREGRMADIVATIQSEQDRVVRAPDDGLMVVQGGPGTGKTAVALHRAAYLLYAQRERLERSGVLVIGPSRVFLRYIEQVLPSLGESGVVSTTMADLVPGVRARALEDEATAQVKGREAWVPVLEAAVRGLERIPHADQVLTVWNRSVTLTPKDVAAAFTRARRAGTPHNVAREGVALELVNVLARRLIVEAGDTRSDGTIDPDDLRMWREEVRTALDVRRAVNLAWMPTTPQALLERLWSRPDLLGSLCAQVGAPFTRAELALVERPPHSPLTVSDVPLLDELEELLGPAPSRTEDARRADSEREAEVARAREAMEAMNLGGGIVTAEMLAHVDEDHDDPLAVRAASDREWVYGHVVVDEAQELSPLAWRALLRRCPSLSFTVVGDLDQRRGHDRPATWEEALGPARRALRSEHVLSVSYRTPRSLTDRAERVMAALGQPVLFPLSAVRDVEDAYALTRVDAHPDPTLPPEGDPLWHAVQEVVDAEGLRLDAEAGPGAGRIAVLVGSGRALSWGADTTGFSGLDQRVSLLGALAAKGLEFDTVVLVEPGELLADGPGDLFVALTRSTRRLHVVAGGPLPEGLRV